MAFDWAKFNQSVKKSAAKRKGKAKKPKGSGAAKGKGKPPAGGGSL